MKQQDSSSATKDAGQEETNSSGGCPMKRQDGSYSYDWRALFQRHPHGPKGSKPLTKDNLVKQEDGTLVPKQQQQSGGCPVKEYNVYSQPLDSTNQMPKVANQLPAPNQTEELSTERVPSSISKVNKHSLCGRKH